MSRLLGDDINLSAAKPDGPVNQGEQGVVTAETYMASGQVRSAALANDYRADSNRLTPVTFDAAILRITVAPVPRGTLTLLMCHNAILH